MKGRRTGLLTKYIEAFGGNRNVHYFITVMTSWVYTIVNTY